MAKLGSPLSSCRPLLQGKGVMLFALLLLASISIQADPVMAFDFDVQPVADLGEQLGEKLRDQVAKAGLTELGKKRPVWGDFSRGTKTGLKVHKYLCKAQGWMDKQGASGTPTPYFAVDIRVGDRIPPAFSFSRTTQGGGNSVFTCWSANQLQEQAAAGTTTLVPSRYPPNDVRITGIRVGPEQVPVQTPAYVSTQQP